MPLELKRQKDGIRIRPYFYGRFEVDGRNCCVKLCPIEGKPHPSLSLTEAGDAKFEKSREKALGILAVKTAEAREKRDAQHWVKRLHELQTGEAMKGFAVADLIEAWERMPKKKTGEELHPRYVADYKATLRRFIDFVQAKHPTMKEVAQVTRAVAGEFMAAEEARGKDGEKVSAKARNDSLKRLRAVFRSLLNEDCVTRNPFDGIPLHTENHVHRRPLTPEDIGKVLTAAADDNFTRPLFVCALSTAMRRGDCCCLKWADVHLDGKDAAGRPVPDHVTTKTSKTGETVTAPVDERLKTELVRAKAKADGKSPFVWPEQAAMQAENQQGVSYRIQQVFERADLGDEARHAERARGVRRASVVDFHSLRTTWITDKLAAGVPIEAVKRTSGHRTTDVVTEHYFKPDVKQHLDALNGGSVAAGADRDEQLRRIIRRMTPNTLKQDKARALAILDGKAGQELKGA
jgi:integrase